MNLINRHDFRDFIRVLRRHHLLLRLRTARGRAISHWNLSQQPRLQLSLMERLNLRISGDAGLSRFDYTSQKYLRDGGLTALSVGCGDGLHEVSWAGTGAFKRILGIDLAQVRIEKARLRAAEHGVEDVCAFSAATLADVAGSAEGSVDVVIFESSLHHLAPMEEILATTHRILKDDGKVLLFDYVGPRRWQWTDQQLRLVNAMIDLLPERYLRLGDGSIMRHRFRPSLLRMLLMDPSEAIESDRIVPGLRERFDELEFRNAGGVLLNHFLPKIQHNFDKDSEADQNWVQLLFSIEDKYLEDDELGMWYAYGVYQKSSRQRKEVEFTH